MPELPEVELVARALEGLVAGRRVERAELLRERLSPGTDPSRFSELLNGAQIRSVGRRGKHILFDLDNGRTLITHLRMSGRFMLLPAVRDDPKFTHAAFHFVEGDRLVFQDQRHFGMMKVVETPDLANTKELSALAPEPFSDSFTPEYLYMVARGSSRSLKELLLDQTKVCGLGNIYAAEALFLAGIHPAKRAKTLSRKRSDVLFEKIRETLREAIDAGSTLNVDPEDLDSSYYGGEYERYWRIYDREDQPCVRCGSLIVRLKQNGRSSYLCPKCQRR